VEVMRASSAKTLPTKWVQGKPNSYLIPFYHSKNLIANLKACQQTALPEIFYLPAKAHYPA